MLPALLCAFALLAFFSLLFYALRRKNHVRAVFKGPLSAFFFEFEADDLDGDSAKKEQTEMVCRKDSEFVCPPGETGFSIPPHAHLAEIPCGTLVPGSIVGRQVDSVPTYCRDCARAKRLIW